MILPISITEGTELYRVRKEEEGCSIFTKSNYVEGNETVYLVLEAISRLGVPNAIKEIEGRFVGSEDEIEADLIALFSTMAEKGILCKTYEDLKLYYQGKKNETHT